MARITGEIVVNRPVADVFDFVADERNEPRFNPRLRKVEQTSAGPVGQGTTFTAQTSTMGRSAGMVIELVGYERPRWLASSTRMAAMDIDGVLTFDPVEDGTRMCWSWDLAPHGALRLAGPVLTRLGQRQERAIWSGLKRLLEGGEPLARQAPLPLGVSVRALARCIARTAWLLATRRVHLPIGHVGLLLRFADGTAARVYRETVVDRAAPRDPCVLVVSFRLRAVRGRGHAAFRCESLLNTPLFVGFPGFVSKLWLAHDQHGTYRGLYEWDRPDSAEAYARALWRVLALVSVPGSIRYHVAPGLHRDGVLDGAAPAGDAGWWRVVGVG